MKKRKVPRPGWCRALPAYLIFISSNFAKLFLFLLVFLEASFGVSVHKVISFANNFVFSLLMLIVLLFFSLSSLHIAMLQKERCYSDVSHEFHGYLYPFAIYLLFIGSE